MPKLPTNAPQGPEADVCIVVEGAYPYIRGGVSSWVQDLIQSQAHLRFHLVIISSPAAEMTLRYPLPPNVSGITHVFVQEVPLGRRRIRGSRQLLAALQLPVARLMAQGKADDLRDVLRVLKPVKAEIGRHILLDSAEAWRSFNEVYEDMCDGASFINSFWGWRSLVAGLYSMVLGEVPPARVYHSISTGYAGVWAARASFETGRPVIVTEHGVYTYGRRLEILAAPWLAIDDTTGFSIDSDANKVKELWINTFVSYSKACYQACSHIITLFEGNYALQVEDGAAPERPSVIPNGIDLPRYANIVRVPNQSEGGTRPPTVALIGRVVPIKDVKTYIRACAILARRVPDARCLILGPLDEDPDYVRACQALVKRLKLESIVEFTGMVDLLEYFGKIDVVVLTSISEAQPLVILEGGAAAVPSVATDVGSCRELILGRSDEVPNLGPGGQITAIANPASTAHAIAELLLDETGRQRCGLAMQARVRAHYDKRSLHVRYATLYQELIERPDAPIPGEA